MKTSLKLLVATDFSRDSQKALDEAVRFAQGRDAVIYLMHAVDRIEACAVDYCLADEVVEAEKNKLVQEARQKLDGEVARIGAVRGLQIIPEVRYGRPYQEIVAEESERDVDVLLIGEHERKTPWQKLRTHLSEKLGYSPVRDTLIVPHAAR